VALFFYRFAPDLIQEGRVVLMLPPLYKVTKENDSKFAYFEKDRNYYSGLGYNVSRFKGLAEMGPNDLRDMINDPEPKEVILTDEPNKIVRDEIIKFLSGKNSFEKKKFCNNIEEWNYGKLFEMISHKKI
jgi:DNA gyrase/topoisomerase IV subunit B